MAVNNVNTGNTGAAGKVHGQHVHHAHHGKHAGLGRFNNKAMDQVTAGMTADGRSPVYQSSSGGRVATANPSAGFTV